VLDSVSGFEDMLLGWIAEDIQEQAGKDAVTGDGTTKIKGLFTETAKYQTHLSDSAGALVNTNFLTVYFALPVKYRRNGAFLMNGGTLATVAAMAYPNLNNTPLAVQNASGDWTILGKPVLESDSAPAIGAANFPVAFGDIASGYAVGIHRSTTILRDPYTATPYIRFYAVARMGGCAWDYQAIRLLKSNNA
jgi:HK97 family phage major capsid protein